jgi:ABC-type spermidine/putrescine transport system permease subunit II
MRVIIPGIVLCIPIVILSSNLTQGMWPWVLVISAPILATGLMSLFIKLKLVETTDNFTKLLRKIPGMKWILT